jgi:hypothetical protein
MHRRESSSLRASDHTRAKARESARTDAAASTSSRSSAATMAAPQCTASSKSKASPSEAKGSRSRSIMDTLQPSPSSLPIFRRHELHGEQLAAAAAGVGGEGVMSRGERRTLTCSIPGF